MKTGIETCIACDAEFLPEDSAWGDVTCGTCMVARIGWLLNSAAGREDRVEDRMADASPFWIGAERTPDESSRSAVVA